MTTLTVLWGNSNDSDDSDVVLQPDPLVSYEYLESFRRKEALEPEKQLMEAMLADAINLYRLHAYADSIEYKRLFSEAQRWLWSDDWRWPFSFRNICEVLGLDASYLRRGLKHWKDHQLSRVPGEDQTVSFEQRTH